MPLDYEMLRLIWWALLGVLLIGFAIFDGFDLGVGFLLPIVGRTDLERRLLINSIGPVWEGNQVWFILGGGAAFAAWPPLYAASFSGFYVAMFILLVALILRPVGFKFRGKVDDPRWRSTCDAALFLGGFVPSLIFGVAFGNLLLGVPFRLDADLRSSFEGGFLDLLSPFPLLCGLVSVAMLAMHGATYAVMKTDGVLQSAAAGTASGGRRHVAAFRDRRALHRVPDRRLQDHEPHRSSRPVQSYPEDGRDRLGRVARQLRCPSLDDGGAHPRLRRLRPRGGAVGCAPRASGIRRERRRGCGDRGDAGPRHVPVHTAFVDSSRREPHRVGLLVEPDDPFHYGDRGRDLPADRPRLHRVGLSRAPRQDTAGASRGDGGRHAY